MRMRIQYLPADDDWGRDDPMWDVTLEPGEREIVAEASGVTLVSVHDSYAFETVYGRDRAEAMWYPQAFVFGLVRGLDAEGRLEHLIGDEPSEWMTIPIERVANPPPYRFGLARSA